VSTPEAAAAPALQASIEEYAAAVVRPVAAAMARGEGPGAHELLRAAAARGLACLVIPEALGGGGAGHLAFAAYIEAVARECASTSVFLDVHGSVASEPILLFGNTEQQAALLPRLGSGEWLGGFALTEAGSGSDAAALVTRAERTASGYRLQGSKAFITSGGVADLYVVMARTGEGTRGITAFLVEATQPGVRGGEPLRKLGLRGSVTAELLLDGVEVAEDRRLGAEGEGFRVAMAALDAGRIGISAQAVGIAQGALDATVASGGGSRDRSAVADMEARIAAARSLTRHAARVLDAGEPVTHIASCAKLFATDTCVAVTQVAVDLCAPDSASEEHPAAIRLRDAKACQIYEGTNQVQRIVIARGLLRA
jgi:alkylation response protein AidB-like acyl-CoA dehydrogenase